MDWGYIATILNLWSCSFSSSTPAPLLDQVFHVTLLTLFSFALLCSIYLLPTYLLPSITIHLHYYTVPLQRRNIDGHNSTRLDSTQHTCSYTYTHPRLFSKEERWVPRCRTSRSLRIPSLMTSPCPPSWSAPRAVSYHGRYVLLYSPFLSHLLPLPPSLSLFLFLLPSSFLPLTIPISKSHSIHLTHPSCIGPHRNPPRRIRPPRVTPPIHANSHRLRHPRSPRTSETR